MRWNGTCATKLEVLVGLFVVAAMTRTSRAETAVRDLSGYNGPDVAFTVSIALNPPGGTIVGALEEAPPVGWAVGAISDGGSWDNLTDQIKWGPLFDPSIPAAVTYELTPPAQVTGTHCFSGSVTFDALVDPIAGDQCLSVAVPSVSEWGIVAMALSVLATGTWILRTHPDNRNSRG